MRDLTNDLLGGLPPTELLSLEEHLRRVPAKKGAILQEKGSKSYFVHFPCGGTVVAFEVVLADGKAVETVLIGREGAIGGHLDHEHLPCFATARVLFPGEFLRLDTTVLRRMQTQSPVISQLFLRYSNCLMAHLCQCVACNASHPMEKRAASVLRYAVDRYGDYDIPLTQEELGTLVGVTREHVSRFVQRLKTGGVIETRRGRLHVRNAVKLEHLCCDCRDVVWEHYESLLSSVALKKEQSTPVGVPHHSPVRTHVGSARAVNGDTRPSIVFRSKPGTV